MTDPIFLLGSHKSGTSLLRSLLDGHPDLDVLPREAHFFPTHGYASGYSVGVRVDPEVPLCPSPSELAHFLQFENDYGISKGDNPLGLKFDLPVFRASYGSENASGACRADFYRYAEALSESLGRGPLRKDQTLVEKSVENVDFFDLLLLAFPKARFVHLVRDPSSILVAMRAVLGRPGRVSARFVSTIQRSFLTAQRGRAACDRLCVLRFEDLLTNPRAEMERLASFLEIESCETMLKPTVAGTSWPGNSSSGRALVGIDARMARDRRTSLLPEEAALLLEHLFPVAAEFGYEPPTPRALGWPRTPNGARNWVVNRAVVGAFKGRRPI